jgi:hypothetical protein
VLRRLAIGLVPSGRKSVRRLGYADAEERQTKLRLAYAINEIIASKRLSQTNAAGRLGVGPAENLRACVLQT